MREPGPSPERRLQAEGEAGCQYLPEGVAEAWFPLFRGSMFSRYMEALHATRQGLTARQIREAALRPPFFPQPGDGGYRDSERYRGWCRFLEQAGFPVPDCAEAELELLCRWGLLVKEPDGYRASENPPLPRDILS